MDIYRAIFEQSPCAFLISDDDGQLVDINPAAERLFGLPRESVIGKKLVDFVAPIRKQNTLSLWSKFRTDGEQTGHIIISRPDGKDRLAMYTAMTDFIPGLHLSLAYDITSNAKPAEI